MSASDSKILQFKDLKSYNNKVKQHIDSKSRSSDISNILNNLYYPYTNGKSLVYNRDVSVSINAGASAAYVDTYILHGYGYKILGCSFQGNVGGPVSVQFYENKGHYWAQIDMASKFTTVQNLTITIIYTQEQSQGG